jgi:hypothetical protein
MSKSNVIEQEGRERSSDPLTGLLQAVGHQLIEQAVEAELQAILAYHVGRRTESGHAGIVRNVYLAERDPELLSKVVFQHLNQAAA